MTRRATLRASDADREQVAERLRHAATEGRLLAEELDERLGVALSARTYGELDALIEDLPTPNAGLRRRSPEPVRRRPAVAVAATVMVAVLLIGFVASAVGGHSHAGHDWSTGSLVWVVWLVIGWRVLKHRRGRVR